MHLPEPGKQRDVSPLPQSLHPQSHQDLSLDSLIWGVGEWEEAVAGVETWPNHLTIHPSQYGQAWLI